MAGFIKRQLGAGAISTPVATATVLLSMPDLDTAAIERLLYEGARRRGVTVDAYRNLVQATADNAAGVTFEKALQVITAFEKMPPGERNALFEQLAIIEHEATRHGMSVSRFVRIMLGGDDGKPPIRH